MKSTDLDRSTERCANPQPIHQAIISVGSNIDPHQNIAESQKILTQETRFLASAQVIETTPVGFQDQPNFLNTAYLVETELEYEPFNSYLKSVEDRLGRVRGPIKSGPRTIDLDIVVWDGQIQTDDYRQHDYVSTPVDQIIQSQQLSLSTEQRSK